MQSMCSMYAAFAWRSFSSSAIRSSIFFRSCTFDAIASCCAFCCSASRICSRSLSFSALACSSHADNSAFSSSMRCEIAACRAAKSGKSSICTGSGAFIAASCAALFVINFAISRKWSSSSAIRLLLLLAWSLIIWLSATRPSIADFLAASNFLCAAASMFGGSGCPHIVQTPGLYTFLCSADQRFR